MFLLQALFSEPREVSQSHFQAVQSTPRKLQGRQGVNGNTNNRTCFSMRLEI